MALILPVQGVLPQIGPHCWLAENCTVVGDVVLGPQCTVWFNAVVRGDVHRIRVGGRTNIQDGAVLHCTYQRAETLIGEGVSIGHRAIVHGCTIGNNVLVGMGAIVMDHAQVQDNCLIAAGAVILENTVCESGWLYAGVPARKVKPLSEEQIARQRETAGNYVMYAGWF